MRHEDDVRRWEEIKLGFGSRGILTGLERYWFEPGMEPEGLRRAWIQEAEKLLNPKDYIAASELLLKAGAYTEDHFKILEPWLRKEMEEYEWWSVGTEDSIADVVSASHRFMPESEEKLLGQCAEADEEIEWESNAILDNLVMAGSKRAVDYILDWLENNAEVHWEGGISFEVWICYRLGSLRRIGAPIPEAILDRARETLKAESPWLHSDSKCDEKEWLTAISLGKLFELGLDSDIDWHCRVLLDPKLLDKWQTEPFMRSYVAGGLEDVLLVGSIRQREVIREHLPEIQRREAEFGNVSLEGYPATEDDRSRLHAILQIADWRCRLE